MSIASVSLRLRRLRLVLRNFDLFKMIQNVKAPTTANVEAAAVPEYEISCTLNILIIEVSNLTTNICW